MMNSFFGKMKPVSFLAGDGFGFDRFWFKLLARTVVFYRCKWITRTICNTGFTIFKERRL